MNEIRLIDANALKANLPEPTNITQRLVYRTLCDFIDNAPTIIWCSKNSNGLPLMDLRPRPTGEWQLISEGNRHECNQCKDYAPSFKDGSEHLTKFCPNCGAQMKGGAE